MNFLSNLLHPGSSAWTTLILAGVIALGLWIGSLRIFVFQIGVAGVLFAGLFFGHYGLTVNPEILEFLREFGLILFVYTIGIQVGPGFFSGFKKDGLKLNAIAAFIVIVGSIAAVMLSRFWHIPIQAAVGMLAGGTTNTPSLAAAQQALADLNPTDPQSALVGMGYAVCYPFGILGIIITMMLLRLVFKINVADEEHKYNKIDRAAVSKIEVMDLKVENPNLAGAKVRDIPAAAGVVISRIQHDGRLEVALPDSAIEIGYLIRAVGSRESLDALRVVVGSPAKIELREARGHLVTSRVLVTRREMFGKSIAELNAYHYGVTLTRLIRTEMEFAATPELRLQMADVLVVVGHEDAAAKFAQQVGNSVKELAHPHLIPVFIGIALGVLLGSIPFQVPGIPAPIKLGLAGGPLIVSILLSRLGRVGPLVWYMPPSANFMLRELGISLFLACVGIKAGAKFFSLLTSGEGLLWFAGGAIITLVPLILAGLWIRVQHRTNYLSICGLLAGSMTDPPALAFANQMTSSNAPVVAYAAVYPLVMVMRIIAAQIIVIFFSS
jgi:putative transport protein